jgi:predicted PurR-regulated permease PerM
MKKNNLLIFKSLLSILPLITLAIFPTLINSIEEINQSLNNKAQITSNQNQEINFETTIKLNTSTSTDASSGKQNLFNHTLDKSGFINTNNSFEFDLNKFKP